MIIIIFRSSSKASKNKSKKLLNLLKKPVQESVSIDDYEESKLEVGDILNEAESSENEDEDEDMTEVTEVTGILSNFIKKNLLQ